jgi:alpha-glucosidase
MLLLTLPGTPTLYYGDELGLPQVAIPPARMRDPWGRNVPGQGRDGCRTPMPWDDSRFAGFSTVEPWLPLNADVEIRNVAMEEGDSTSILTLYRRLIVLRRTRPALNRGTYRPVAQSGGALAFVREAEGNRCVVALNFTGESAELSFGSMDWAGRVALGTLPDRDGETVVGGVTLRPNEGLIISCEG